MTTASSNIFLEAPLILSVLPKEHQSIQMQLVRVSVIIRHKCILTNVTCQFLEIFTSAHTNSQQAFCNAINSHYKKHMVGGQDKLGVWN